MKIKLMFVITILFFGAIVNAQTKDENVKKDDAAKAKVTFVELGSVNCIPCKQMVPVMKAIEKKYGDQIEVVFHDVWKQEEKHFAQEFGIKLIPTQVFLDENGKEFHRHEGFYPEAEIDKVLMEKGLTPVKKEG